MKQSNLHKWINNITKLNLSVILFIAPFTYLVVRYILRMPIAYIECVEYAYLVRIFAFMIEEVFVYIANKNKG